MTESETAAESAAGIVAEIRAHRAEYREGQRRQDELSFQLQAAVAAMAGSVRELERDMAAVKVRIEAQSGIADRLAALERRQSWLFGAASVAGAGLGWLSRRLFG